MKKAGDESPAVEAHFSTEVTIHLLLTLCQPKLSYGFWAAPHEASNNRMAAVGGNLAGDARDDFGVGGRRKNL